MDILITPVVVSSYMKSLNKINKTDEEKITNLIFENSNNRFILNKRLIDFYESQFAPDSYEFVKFQDEMVILLNNKGINKKTEKTNLDEVLVDTEKKYLSDKRCNEIYINISDTEENSLKNDYSAVLENFSETKSRHHTFFYLAAYNPIGLTKRYYDFASNDEITEFLENIYKLKTTNTVNIFDKNRNLTHNYYNFFKNKGISLNYYTLRHHTFNFLERSNQYRTIRDFFNRCSLSVYRAPLRVIHERRLMFNNITIEFDNDPANILIEEPNWKIDVYVCSNIKSEMDNKGRDLFTRDTAT